MAPQQQNGNGTTPTPTNTNGTNGHRSFLNGNSTRSSQPSAPELNPKEHDIKVVIRNGRIVAGEETLPFKRKRFGFGMSWTV